MKKEISSIGAENSQTHTREPFTPGELVFDVGANVGDKAAEFLARGARVVCFEPQPDCVAQLRERFADDPRVVIEAVGLAAKAGELELSICSAANTISTFSADWKRGRFANYQWDRQLRVPVITLDEAIARHGRPAYVKVDVEGFELDVLRGLSSRVPLLSFEYTAEFLARNRECAQHLESLGFREFNAKLGTVENYLSDSWLSAGELFTRLASSPDMDLWGDIYARAEAENTKTGNPPANPSFLDELLARRLWHTGQPLKLHLGCGEQHFEGYVNVDYPPARHTCQTRIGADVFADIAKLSFPPQSVDEIRLHHVFEHFVRAEALALLIRWHEALKIGGRLHLETPDLDGCARQLVSDIPLRMKQAVVRHCFGSQEAGWANHYDLWTEARFQNVLSQLGFHVQTRASTWQHPPHLANVEAFATKLQHISRPELLATADRILSEYTVSDVPSEREMCEAWRRAMRAFLAVNGPAPFAGVIFSKDRPLQLDGTLRSFFARCQDADQCRLKVLYCASKECQPHYETLVQEYTTVEFIAEQDFRNDLLHLLSGSELVLFLVDDNLFVRNFTLAEVADALRRRPEALGFSLRLGRNTTFCYPFNKSQNVPPFEEVTPRVLAYDWRKAEGDFTYPLEVSSSAYRAVDVLPLLRESSFQNPNTLEGELAARASRLSNKPQLLCFETSRTFCNPINMVQRICPNRAGGRAEHSPEQLARQFSAGARLDVEAYQDFTPIGCHQEVPLRFISVAAPVELAVSIVVPCFKQAHYLSDAIQSVLAQTFTDWEVIIVNDGSPDDTSRVARELIACHPERRIRLLEITNGGPGRARNAGIREARGKFILPLDADDQIAPEFLAKTVAYLEKHPDVPIVGTYRKDFGLAEQVHPVSDYTLAMILEDNRLNYCSLYRREIWQAVGGYDAARAIGYEDWSFWISCAERGWFAQCISEPLFLYRVKLESRFTETQARDAMQRAQIVLRHAASYPPQRVTAAQRILEQASVAAPASQKIPAPLPSGPTQNSPTVSVIVPTFNRPVMLLETLRSILTQSYQDFEIIVINDAGEDVTAALATLGEVQKIRHLRHEVNKGLGAARNTGIKAALGKYIAYLDDDDIFQSNHLQTLVEHLEATRGEVAYTDAYRAHQRKNGDAYEVFARDVPYSFEFDYDCILEKNFIPVLCIMHRKTCWEAAGGFDESLPVLEDWDLWIRMSRLYDFTHIAKVTCEFRWRTDGSTMTLACNEKFARTTDIIVAKRAHLLTRKNTARAGLGKRPTDQPVNTPGLPTQDEFDEFAYLRANPDVAAAVLTHALESGWQHYVKYGSAEQRPWFRNETTSAEAESSPFYPAQTS